MATRARREAARIASRQLTSIGDEFRHGREDAGLSQRHVADAAGISQSYCAEIEAGAATPSVEVIDAIAIALGGSASLRFFPGTGSRLRDRFQAPMVECFIRALHSSWAAHPEVQVHRPASGVIDLALVRPAERLLVATEFHSQIRRLEQQIRWARLKADGLPDSPIGAELAAGSQPVRIERLLVLRSTAATRELARDFEVTLRAAYPARTADVLDALLTGSAWPGSGIVWMTVDKGETHLVRRSLAGVALGR